MSNKDFYDEDEIINSLVDEKTPRKTENTGWNQQNSHPNIHVRQMGCGCFDGRKFLTNFIIYGLVLMTTAGLLPGFYINGIFAALQAAFILTLLNTFVKPLIVFATFPLTLATLGLFYFIINAIIVMMTASIMGDNFVITNIFVAFFATIFISILQQFIRKILKVDQL